jgi:hypothetical protein
MFASNIAYDRLNTVTQENNYNFNLISIPGVFPSNDISQPTIIPFYKIENFISN